MYGVRLVVFRGHVNNIDFGRRGNIKMKANRDKSCIIAGMDTKCITALGA